MQIICFVYISILWPIIVSCITICVQNNVIYYALHRRLWILNDLTYHVLDELNHIFRDESSKL